MPIFFGLLVFKRLNSGAVFRLRCFNLKILPANLPFRALARRYECKLSTMIDQAIEEKSSPLI